MLDGIVIEPKLEQDLQTEPIDHLETASNLGIGNELELIYSNSAFSPSRLLFVHLLTL